MILPNSPLYDYFAVIGYNPEFGLKQERKAEFGEGNSPNGPRSPLEASYEAKVIAHFPSERRGRPFVAEIASLALPSGVRLFTEQNVPHEPSFHSFVIVREDGSRLYGCSLVFYEELRSVELRQQIFDAQMYFLRDFASNQASSSFPSTLTTNSPYSKGTLLQQKQHISKKFTTHSLPRKFSASGRRNSSNVNTSDQNNGEDHSAYYTNPKSLLFASKCMAVLTPLPVIYSSENLLHNLWLIFNDKFPVEAQLSLDDALFWTLNQIPLPSPGESMCITHPQFQLLVRIPTLEEFPYFDYPMETIFNFLSVEKFIKLLTNFMLEKQILLVSKHARTLMLFGECLSAFVFPFSWQMAYCPILPHSQLKFLEAPVPWLMGICYEDENLPEDFSQFNICFLDIDTRRLDLPEDLPSFPKSHQLTNKITALLTEFSEAESTSSNKKRQIHDFYLRGLRFNKALRSIFLSHFASLFTSYENYLLNADINTNCETPNKSSRTTGRLKSARILRESSANFDKISFLVDQPESVLPFLSAFLETQMFTSFIDSKILSLQNSAQVGNDVLIFDQKIAELREGAVLESQLYNSEENEVTSLNHSKVHQISAPTSSKIPLQKYNGQLLIMNPSLLEENESTTMTNLCEVDGSLPTKQYSIKTALVGSESKQQTHKKTIDEGKNDNKEDIANTLIIKENDGTAPMNLAHQNWKFVEQLLKETKAKTKRILVAKMGKEAIHLGHGQLHLGISGVEENTLVASFCDLLERIWSHGLKKKQGKSALWTYIIAYHEWEKRINSSKASSRRASSIGFENNSNNISASTHERLLSPTSNEVIQDISSGESPRALLDLIASFRKIGGASPSMDSRDNSPHSSSTDSLSNFTNNWSQSLLKAANVICERISQQQATNDEKTKKSSRNNSKGRLPPLPPPPTEQKSLPNWKLRTPKLLRRRKSSGFAEEEEEKEDELNKKSSENFSNNSEVSTKETYRKFIFQSPLKTVNNNQQIKEGERRSRSTAKIPTPPRSASCCQSGREGNLASRFSEDSLSRISSNYDPTTPKRRPRDMSASGVFTNCQQQKMQYGRNRSLSRTNSPSRLYERLTRGMMGYGGGGGDLSRSMSPLPNTMAYDLKNIVRMTEIKTDIGFARAFVRIALERKLLYQYLKKLLSNTQLLQKLYKRYSFLRCDDEREQFLFHLLSLNAVDFSCFTNTFLTIKMRYQVLMAGGLDRFPDSFVYIVLTGSLGYTSQISLPANNTQFTFDYKNLGILSTLRVGHKISSERSNHRPIKWFLDYVLVRNCVTAQTFYFRCGRWFGRGIDDGALERLLVAEAIVLHPVDEDQEEGNDSNSVNCSESPLSNAFLSPRKTNKYYDNSDNSSFQLQNHQRARSRLRSPSSERRLFGITDNSSESSSGRVMDETLDTLQSLEHKAGMAVNALMKHFLTISECGQQQQYIGNNSKLSLLLCSDDGGLLSCFNEIFSHGLIQKFFQKIYPWDYVEKVFVWFGEFFRNGEAKKLTREQRSLIIYAYKMVEKIAAHSIVGKEGRFNLFMLLCLRDHIFSGLIPLIIWTPITTQFYEQSAFIRHSSKVSYLVKLVGSLNEFQFDYEQSLTHGLVF
ncbi:hypothetical protein ACQ4LE_005773 [Meloidogyne hapla]